MTPPSRSCSGDTPSAGRPGFVLGLVLGALACRGGGEAPEARGELDARALPERLRETGAEVQGGDETVSQPFFSVRGRTLTLEGDTLQVFEYDSAPAAIREAGRVSPDGTIIGEHQVDWVDPPRFYRSGRLIVLHVGTSAAARRALEAVLGPAFAGPP